MFWIDGASEPTLYGTGTEDYFGGAWGFRHQYTMPNHGVSYLEKLPWRERRGRRAATAFTAGTSATRFRSRSRSRSRSSGGHNNSARDSAYSSVAYWYERP